MPPPAPPVPPVPVPLEPSSPRIGAAAAAAAIRTVNVRAAVAILAAAAAATAGGVGCRAAVTHETAAATAAGLRSSAGTVKAAATATPFVVTGAADTSSATGGRVILKRHVLNRDSGCLIHEHRAAGAESAAAASAAKSTGSAHGVGVGDRQVFDLHRTIVDEEGGIRPAAIDRQPGTAEPLIVTLASIGGRFPDRVIVLLEREGLNAMVLLSAGCAIGIGIGRR